MSTNFATKWCSPTPGFYRSSLSTQASQNSLVFSHASLRESGNSDVIPNCQYRQMVELGGFHPAQIEPKQYKSHSYRTEIGSPSGAPRLEEYGFEKEPLCFKLCRWSSRNPPIVLQMFPESRIFPSARDSFTRNGIKEFSQSEATPYRGLCMVVAFSIMIVDHTTPHCRNA